MNRLVGNVRQDEALVTKRGAAAAPQDALGKARAALDEAVAQAHEAGDWYALRILHSLTALLAATRH